MAASVSTLPASTSASRPTSAPSSTTSSNSRVSGPACGTIEEWNISAPPRGWRHWKNITPREPRATCDMLSRAISPGRLVAIRPGSKTRLVACSTSSQGSPRAHDRARSAANAVSCADVATLLG